MTDKPKDPAAIFESYLGAGKKPAPPKEKGAAVVLAVENDDTGEKDERNRKEPRPYDRELQNQASDRELLLRTQAVPGHPHPL